MNTSEFSSVFLERRHHPYYIVAPRYIRTSAGVKALHLLCHALNRMGERAYLILNPHFHPYYATHPDLITPVLTRRTMEKHYADGLTPITIYPESIKGNPYQVPFVVRYVLNFAGLLGGDSTYPEDEYCIAYSKAIADTLTHCHQTIFIPASDPNFFTPEEGVKRSGACYYAGKYKHFHGGKTFPITEGLVEITRDRPDSQTPEEIRDLFRKSELFYCYENSALAIEAMLCGCPVVFLPNEYFTELIGKEELGGLGYSWGADPQQIEHAKRTVPQARNRFLDLYVQAESAVLDFINQTQEAVASVPYKTILKAPQISAPSLLDQLTSLSKMTRLLVKQHGLRYTAQIVSRRLWAKRLRIKDH